VIQITTMKPKLNTDIDHEIVDEELIEQGLDGGFWCLWTQTWRLPDGAEVQVNCEGSIFNDERVNHEIVESD